MNQSEDKRLAEVKNRVEERFVNSKSNNSNSPSFDAVEPGSSVSNTQNNQQNTVKLTSEEVHIARSLNITPEQYAKQKLIIEGGK